MSQLKYCTIQCSYRSIISWLTSTKKDKILSGKHCYCIQKLYHKRFLIQPGSKETRKKLFQLNIGDSPNHFLLKANQVLKPSSSLVTEIKKDQCKLSPFFCIWQLQFKSKLICHRLNEMLHSQMCLAFVLKLAHFSFELKSQNVSFWIEQNYFDIFIILPVFQLKWWSLLGWIITAYLQWIY